MQIDGGFLRGYSSPYRLAPSVNSPLFTNESPLDTFKPPSAPVDGVLSWPESNDQNGALLFGNVSLDLYVSRSESLAREYTSEGPDGYQSLRQKLERRFESSLSLDFSFLAKLDGAAEKLNNLDSSVFSEWTNVATRLLDMKEDDFEDFVNATDELFNEIEKVLGMGPEGLDYVADFFTGKVDDFLNGVKGRIDYYGNNPLGEAEDLGLRIPDLAEAIKESIPNDLKIYLEELMAYLESRLMEGRELMGTLLKSISELYKDIVDRYSEEDENEDTQINPDIERPEEGESENKSMPAFSKIQYSQYYHYEYTQSVSISYTRGAS